jgi:phosphonate transport system substrate-binding protein
MTRPTHAAAVLALFVLLASLAAGCGEKPAGEESAGGGQKSGKASKELVLGFVPSQESDKIADTAKPMAEFLSKELGVPVRPFVSTNYVGLIEAMGSGKVDIGSLPPLAYVLAHDQKAAEILLKTERRGRVAYHAMFVARADSGIKTVEQARGKRMAWVEPASTSGYLFPAAYLKARGYDPDKFFKQTTFAGGHDKALIAVYNGDVDVAAVYDDAREVVAKSPAYKDIMTKVVKIGRTDAIPNDTISVRTGLDPALKEKIRAAFHKFASTPEGSKTLMDVYRIERFRDATDAEYEPVRRVARAMDVPLSSIK